MRIFVVFVLFFQVVTLGSPSLIAQVKPVSIQQVDSLMQKEPKPVIILLSTDWCSYCRIQKKQIADHLLTTKKAEEFYWVYFDAESTDEITFQHHLFQNKAKQKSRGNYHDLAIALNEYQQLQFPTWVVLNKSYEIVFRYNGLLQPEEQKLLIEKL